MREQEFHARDKKVQKMTRDGLTERNLTQGTQQRISSRVVDISFARDKPEDAQADIRDSQQPGRKHRNSAVLHKNTGIQSGAGNSLTPVQNEAVQPIDTAVPEVCGARDTPYSNVTDNRSVRSGTSHHAGGSMLISDSSCDMGGSPAIPENLQGTGNRLMESVPPGQETKTQTESERVKASFSDVVSRQLKSGSEKSGGTADRKHSSMKKRQTAKFASDGARGGIRGQAEPDSDNETVSVTDHKGFKSRSRLKFEPEEIKNTSQKDRMTMKKKQAAKFAAYGAGSTVFIESGNKEPVVCRDELKTEVHLDQTAASVMFFSETETEAYSECIPHLRSDKNDCLSQSPKKHNHLLKKDSMDMQNHTSSVREPAGKSRQQIKYEKAQKQAEKAEKKLEKAQNGLPTRRRVRLTGQYDSGTGKAGRRLHFETEIIPENAKAPLVKRAGVQTVTSTVSMKMHQKIRENEQDNVGVETAHKAESAAEHGTGRYLRNRKHRLHEKPYREMRRAEKRMSAASAYQKLIMDKPELQKKAFSRWLQKQKLRQKYAAAAREAAKGAQRTTNVLTAIGQTVRALAQTVASKKTVVGIVAAGALVMSMSGALFSSCSAMLTGIQSAIVSTCYVAEDSEINASELVYTELETDLQITVNNTETDYPGYDEYRYSIGEIGHSPYELMGYLSAAYDDFSYAQVAGELSRLFGLQYELVREEVTETRTYTDDEGQEHEYEWHVLKTTLSVKPLSEIIAASLPSGDPADRYGVYMQTCGNRQCYGNPFDSAWVSRVTSPYGYRIHPISGEKDLHRGVDISAAEGTPILAVQDGRVVSAGDAGAYGLCVVIEGEDGYQSRYAHCSSFSVSTGQEVKRGDVIAAVGSTGTSTGAHLHLEVTHNGEYLNPYFYVDNGGGGYLPGGGAAQGPDFSENPGSAMGDGSFAAMLEEAEKYLGFPYVWGGSSPSTSFDCSGYVSWVVNHSGVGNVGRQTAQGLFNLCTPVSRADMQPGDLVFFTGTYSTANPVTHVGIYVGGGRMIHCGSPISYASIDGNYWSSKFYSGGRLP